MERREYGRAPPRRKAATAALAPVLHRAGAHRRMFPCPSVARCPPALLLPLLLPFAALPAAAQVFPDRPVRIVVPINPGGGTDLFARRLAETRRAFLRQPVVVDNRPGASGTVGVQQVVDAPPDGHTLGFVWNTPLTAAPHTLGARYTAESFASVFSVGYSAYTLCAQPDFPASSLPEFVARVRARPGELHLGQRGPRRRHASRRRAHPPPARAGDADGALPGRRADDARLSRPAHHLLRRLRGRRDVGGARRPSEVPAADDGGRASGAAERRRAGRHRPRRPRHHHLVGA